MTTRKTAPPVTEPEPAHPGAKPPLTIAVPPSWTPREAEIVWMFLNDVADAVFAAYHHELVQRWSTDPPGDRIADPAEPYDEIPF